MCAHDWEVIVHSLVAISAWFFFPMTCVCNNKSIRLAPSALFRVIPGESAQSLVEASTAAECHVGAELFVVVVVAEHVIKSSSSGLIRY